MRFDYDPQVDALYIRLNEAKIIRINGVRLDIISRHTMLIGNCIVVSDRIAQLRR